MTFQAKALLVLSLLFCVQNVSAEAIATIEALQIPVIIERGESRIAAKPGIQLKTSDRILTGSNSRVLMRLADNSTVKLGENVEFELKHTAEEAADNETFQAALNVIKGAFRFTTGLVNKYRKRNVTATVNTVTIGIRGTDVWGKSEPNRDFVVLLEGKIDIQRNQEPPVSMSEPLSLFMAPTGQAAQPITEVNQDDLAIWAQETELQIGAGIINQEGKYRLHLASYENPAVATAKQQALIVLGYPAELSEVVVNDKTWTRLSINGIVNINEARYLQQMMQDNFGFTGTWIQG